MEEFHQEILELVQEGAVFATTRLNKERRVFVAGIYATDEDKEFTRAWLENPHFGLNS